MSFISSLAKLEHFGNAGNQTRGCWVRSPNTTSVGPSALLTSQEKLIIDSFGAKVCPQHITTVTQLFKQPRGVPAYR